MAHIFTEDGRETRVLMIYAVVAAALGIGLSAWLAYLHIEINTDPSYMSVCALGKTVNCETVAASTYSVFWGLPVSIWGLIAYLLAISLVARDLRRGERAGTVGMLSILSMGMVIVSLVLAWISTFVIKAVCLFCAAVYLASFVFAGLVFCDARRRGGVSRNLRLELAVLKRSPWIVVLSGILVAAVLIAGPLGVFPRYWELASWREGPSMPHGFDADGRPWLGASNPKLVVHEYLDYECPHCHVAHRKLRRILLANSQELRIVRHDYARMACAPNDEKKRLSKCSAARAAHCAAKRDRFWEWNDAVMADPKPLSGGRRDQYEIDMAMKLGFDRGAFERCMFDAETVDFTEREYKEARDKGVRDTPMYRVGDEVLNLNALDILIDKLL
jgi:uncharacterized membrane protein